MSCSSIRCGNCYCLFILLLFLESIDYCRLPLFIINIHNDIVCCLSVCPFGFHIIYNILNLLEAASEYLRFLFFELSELLE
jgi:hypothetical protein